MPATTRTGCCGGRPLLLRFGDRVYPSLALAAARRALGGGPVVLDARSDGSMMMTVASRPVSLDAQGRLLLRLPPAARRPAPISAADVLDGRVPRRTDSRSRRVRRPHRRGAWRRGGDTRRIEPCPVS